MPGWDEDSPELRANLTRVLRQAAADASARVSPGHSLARSWHYEMMKGLDLPHPEWAGGYRGEPALEDCWVRVGGSWGVPPSEVAEALTIYEQTLRRAVAALDAHIPVGRIADETTLPAVLRLCAWAHAEWVRIHPFANGNGRTARLWANFLGIRYGLPPFVRLRPRPTGLLYARAARAAMAGDPSPTVEVFHRLLREHLGG